jgi:hypothetical protein
MAGSADAMTRQETGAVRLGNCVVRIISRMRG